MGNMHMGVAKAPLCHSGLSVSHLREVNETLFAASVPMKKEADAGVLPAHFEHGGDTSGTRWKTTG